MIILILLFLLQNVTIDTVLRGEILASVTQLCDSHLGNNISYTVNNS